MSHLKPVKIITNGRCDTVPFPLLYNRTGSGVQHQLKRTKGSGTRCCCNSRHNWRWRREPTVWRYQRTKSITPVIT